MDPFLNSLLYTTTDKLDTSLLATDSSLCFVKDAAVLREKCKALLIDGSEVTTNLTAVASKVERKRGTSLPSATDNGGPRERDRALKDALCCECCEKCRASTASLADVYRPTVLRDLVTEILVLGFKHRVRYTRGRGSVTSRERSSLCGRRVRDGGGISSGHRRRRSESVGI